MTPLQPQACVQPILVWNGKTFVQRCWATGYWNRHSIQEKKSPRGCRSHYIPSLTHGFAQSYHHKHNQGNHLINKMAGNPNTLQRQAASLLLISLYLPAPPFPCGSYSLNIPVPLLPPLQFLQAQIFGEGLLYKILGGEVEKIHFCVVAKLVLAM